MNSCPTLRDIEAAKQVGREACNEIVTQGEKLDAIEQDLSAIDRDLDFGDKLLRRLKSPTLHLFSDDSRPKASASKASSPQRSQQSGRPRVSHRPWTASTTPGSVTWSDSPKRWASLKCRPSCSTARRVEARSRSSASSTSSNVTARVEKQTKQASAALDSGPRLF